MPNLDTNDGPTVRELFLLARRVTDPDEQVQLLDQHCAGNAELRRQVEAMLTVAAKPHRSPIDQIESALGPPTDAFDPAARKPDLDIDSHPMVGRYKLIEQIGEGGMGIVYMAEQQEPVRRSVALKVIKPGMDTQQVVARFESERQALALMNHPNIAKVLDAGTTDAGLPYFVMELVKGIPITEFCDRHRLDNRQRLELFITACRAVHHAHQKGVIHRDLKPSNVMVELHDVKPVPKIIDFGVAKATNQRLTDRTLHTGYAQIIGTPTYMSPEQAELSGLDVDIRSDIYSLGVLLYELLTGATPFDRETLRNAGFDEMRRIIREDEPPKPSAMISTLKAAALSTVSHRRGSDPRKLSDHFAGELDWVVMKALEKDRNRRYESARDLAQDIQCHLDDKPVQACPPSIFYCVSKFAKRNRRTMIGSMVVATLAVITIVQFAAVTVQRNRQRRELELNVEREVTATHAAIESNDLAAAELYLSRANAVLGNSSQNEPQLAEGLNRLALRLETNRSHRKQFAKLSQNYREMWMLADTKDEEATRLAIESLGLFGVLNAPDDQLRLQNGTLASADRLQIKDMLFETLILLAYIERKDRSSQGLEARLRYLNLAESIHEPIYSLYRLRRDVYSDIGDDGNVARMATLMEGTTCSTALDYFVRGQLTSRIDKNRAAAISCYEKALLLEPNNFPSLFYLAYRLGQSGNSSEAARVYQACLALRPRHALTMSNLASQLGTLGQHEQAIKVLDRAIKFGARRTDIYINRGVTNFHLARLKESITDFDKAIELNPQHSQAYLNRGEIYQRLGDHDKAIADFNKVLEFAKRKDKAKAYTFRAISHFELDDANQALEDIDQAIAIDPKLPLAYQNRGHIYRRLGEFTKAIVATDEAIELTSHSATSDLAALYSNRGGCYFDQQDFDRALIDIKQAIELQPRNSYFHCCHARALAAQERYAEAESSFSRAIELDSDNSQVYGMAAQFRASCPDSAYRDPPQTLRLAQKAVELDQRSADAWVILAFAQYRSGDHNRAIDSASKALDLDDDVDARVYLVSALAHQASGNHDDALRQYAQATILLQERNSKDKDLLRLRDEVIADLGLNSEVSMPSGRNGR